MNRYRIEKAEEGTRQVDAFLAAGFEPFAVVSEPVQIGQHYSGSNWVPTFAYVNVIWFRRNDNV